MSKFIPSLLVLFVSLCFCEYSMGQSADMQQAYLQVTKKSTGKTRILEEGKRLKVSANGFLYKGDLNIIDAKLISIGGDTLSISDITKIMFKSSATKVVGGMLLGGGVLGIGLSALMIEAAYSAGGFGAFLIITFVVVPIAITAALATLTGTIILCTGKKYKSSKWKYQVIQPGVDSNKPSPWNKKPGVE